MMIPTHSEILSIRQTLAHQAVIAEVLPKRDAWALLGRPVHRKTCLCENYELNNQFIIKTFRYPKVDLPRLRWWQQEDKVLSHINGRFNTPLSYGYLELETSTERQAVFIREKIAGNTLKEWGQARLTHAQAAALGQLLAQFHTIGVVTRDCHLDNLLTSTREGERLHFIDFGKAKHFSRPSMAFYYQAGWDCWKACWQCVQLDDTLSQQIMSHYWQHLECTKTERALYRVMHWLASSQHRLRRWKRSLRR